ncbi:MAG: uracil-DNA glycosylase, partial [Sphaerochaetaceae bacterium]
RLFGQGPVKPKVMFILDQPSQSDVKAKALFSGLEGAFFDKWIAAISLRREDVFLTSLLRCHHDPIAKYASPEVINCQAFLKTQIALVQPAFIFGLGELTAQVFFKRPDSLETLRGRIKPAFGVPVLCSYSMAQVLSDPAKKPLIWADLKTLRSNLEL